MLPFFYHTYYIAWNIIRNEVEVKIDISTMGRKKMKCYIFITLKTAIYIKRKN